MAAVCFGETDGSALLRRVKNERGKNAEGAKRDQTSRRRETVAALRGPVVFGTELSVAVQPPSAGARESSK